MNKTDQYPQGYLPKVAYHLARRDYQKAEYFAQRQKETYGPIEPQDMIKIMAEVNRIQDQYQQEEREFNLHLGRF
jgi:hypothetical protein